MQSWAEDFLELLDSFVLGDGLVVEVRMVAPRDWRTSVACNTVRLACKMDGVVQYVGYSHHVTVMRYSWLLACKNEGTCNAWGLGQYNTHPCHGAPSWWRRQDPHGQVLLFQVVQLVFCYNQNVHSVLCLLTCWGCVKKNEVKNSSQSWSGQFLLTVARPTMKCSLNVAMACSAALTRWL